jgi:hypothetical protein
VESESENSEEDFLWEKELGDPLLPEEKCPANLTIVLVKHNCSKYFGTCVLYTGSK